MIGRRKVCFRDISKFGEKQKDGQIPFTEINKLEKASEVFWDAIINAGSLVITCEFCGRTYFGSYSEGWYDEGELEDLRASAKKEPDKYIELYDTDSISWGYIDGRQAVYSCACNNVVKYENWIWQHRHLISQYLNKRVKKMKEDLKAEQYVTSQLKEVE